MCACEGGVARYLSPVAAPLTSGRRLEVKQRTCRLVQLNDLEHEPVDGLQVSLVARCNNRLFEIPIINLLLDCRWEEIRHDALKAALDGVVCKIELA